MNQELIAYIKQSAIEELCSRFAKVERGVKADGSFVTEADLAMQKRLQSYLLEHFPGIAFLSEEMDKAEQEAMLDNETGVWVLDPLDGTSNFSAGIPYYAVSLALIQNGEISWGMVYDPERDECFTAEAGKGAWLNGERLKKKNAGVSLSKATALVDFKRLTPELAARLASQPPYSSQRSFGGVALDWCWLAIGRSHVYLHGNQNLWDYAAGSLVFHETGGKSCTLEGEPVFNNKLMIRSAVAAMDDGLFKGWTNFLDIEK